MAQLNLAAGVKDQTDTCKRFAGQDFLQVVFTFEVLEATRIPSICGSTSPDGTWCDVLYQNSRWRPKFGKLKFF